VANNNLTGNTFLFIKIEKSGTPLPFRREKDDPLNWLSPIMPVVRERMSFSFVVKRGYIGTVFLLDSEKGLS
jgi:hypothetical protein